MIRYNSREVSEKLFNFAMNQAYYETTAFFWHRNCISSCRIFVLYKWQGRLFTSLNIFSRLFYLLEDIVIFFTKPTGFFDIRGAHFE